MCRRYLYVQKLALFYDINGKISSDFVHSGFHNVFFLICLYKIFFLSSQYSIILRKSFPILRFLKNHLFCDRGYSPPILFPLNREPWDFPGGPMVKTLPSSREVKVKVTQLCLTLCDPMDYIVHGILQARILEWVAFPFSRASSQPGD